MAYYSASDPIPQNSLMAPPAWKTAAANARLARNAEISRTGRERAYANLPTLENLASVGGLGLATAARWAIDASEQAREAILIGVGDPTASPSLWSKIQGALQDLQLPQVFSLNGSGSVMPPSAVMGTVSGAVNDATARPTMPQAAPIPTLGVYLNPATKGPVKVQKPGPSMGPGCRGLSGFSPPWGNAFSPDGSGQVAGAGGLLGWVQSHPWIAAAVVGGGLLLASRTGKGRRF